MPIHIEKISNNHQIEIIEELAREIWNEHFTPIIGKSQIDYMLEKFQSKKSIAEQIEKGYLYFLIRKNSRHIGYFGVFPEDDHLFLSKLYITSSERGKGYGRKTIEFIEALTIEKKLRKMLLTVNRNNSDTIETYKKLSFVVQRSIVKDIGNNFVMDDYEMVKDI